MTTLHTQPPWIEMTVATPPAGAGGLSVSVQAGQGALCESIGAGEHFYATFVNASNVRETVQIAGQTGDSFTLTERGCDGGYLNGTTRTPGGYGSWATGDKLYVGWTRLTLEEMVALSSKEDDLAEITTDVTLTEADVGAMHRFTASGTATLPAASADLIGKRIRVKNAGYWNAQVARSGSNTIDGATANVRVPGLETMEFLCVGATAWELVQGPSAEVGDIVASGATARRGCVLGYGQELSRTTYPGLDAVFGTTFGAYTNGSGAVGTTHFRVPDLRGRVLAGKDDMGGSAASRLTNAVCGITATTLGAAGGSQLQQTHAHTGTTGNESATHYHGGTTNSENAQHVHGVGGGAYNFVLGNGGTSGQEGALQRFSGDTIVSTTDVESAVHQHEFATGTQSANHTHGFTTSETGGGSSGNVQPTLIASIFVKL
jgi:microcystin-dependent protein